ncbi:uncharacterized protein LOC108605795 [Drosophila busckii]|uniref:uncharacterized protein LOC108605795 n=1 Tax=Drosophila busckii TaxID=30019 RepID=UPI00083E9C0E|nr:uncharacterized protein LOC108605795 [Drosophila busckii]
MGAYSEMLMELESAENAEFQPEVQASLALAMPTTTADVPFLNMAFNPMLLPQESLPHDFKAGFVFSPCSLPAYRSAGHMRKSPYQSCKELPYVPPLCVGQWLEGVKSPLYFMSHLSTIMFTVEQPELPFIIFQLQHLCETERIVIDKIQQIARQFPIYYEDNKLADTDYMPPMKKSRLTPFKPAYMQEQDYQHYMNDDGFMQSAAVMPKVCYSTLSGKMQDIMLVLDGLIVANAQLTHELLDPEFSQKVQDQYTELINERHQLLSNLAATAVAARCQGLLLLLRDD